MGGIETYLRPCFLVKRTYQGYTYSLDNTSEISGAVVELFYEQGRIARSAGWGFRISLHGI